MTTHGFYDATTDEEQIRSWWTLSPDAGIAAPTGAVSGVVVLDGDIDEAEGVNGEAEIDKFQKELGLLPAGPRSRTGRAAEIAPVQSLHRAFSRGRTPLMREAGTPPSTGIERQTGVEEGSMNSPPAKSRRVHLYLLRVPLPLWPRFVAYVREAESRAGPAGARDREDGVRREARDQMYAEGLWNDE